ncbi:MAG: efflux RND transporter permease subunit [Thermodesulfobacteriota bacterium]
MANETQQKSLTDRIVEGYVAFIWRHRPIVLVIILAITAFWAYHARKVEMYSQFADLLPQGHDYIQAYNQHRETFGGANIVTLVLQVKEGDIFNTETLKKIRYVTDQVDQITGVDHNQVASISHVKIRNVKTLPGGMVRSYPVLPVDIPTDPKELEVLKFEMFNNDIVLNKYVSEDGKAALVFAGFNEDRLDYREIHREISRIRKEVEDENTSLFVAGEPMLKGWVWYFTNELFLIFTFTGLFVIAALVVYFRRTYGVIVPLIGASIQAVWGLGWIGFWGFNLDPLILVIPLLITARSVSHAVQMIERYFEELEVQKNQERAAFTCMNDLFLPGFTGVLSDAGGILVLSIATIPLIQKLAYYGSWWAFANLFCITHLMPILLSYFPTPKKTEHFVPRWMQVTLTFVGRLTTNTGGRWAILLANVIIIIFGVHTALTIPIGEQEAGSPLLWQDSHYNVSARTINERFAGANQLVIYLEGEREHILKEPYVLATIEELRRYMLDQPEAGDTRELYTLARGLNRLYHYNDPRWQVIPPDLATTGNLIFVYEASAPISGVILEYTDLVYKNGQFVVFYKDTKGDTVREAIARAKKFIAEHPIPGVKMRLAGGFIGTTAALNEEIDKSEKQATMLVILTVYLLVWMSYGSFVAANMVMIALIAAGVASYMYISFMGIGLNINSLPVTAVGMGIGVDYILYVVDRIRREVPLAGGDMMQGIRRAISTTGMAVTFTATTMIAGIIPWYFMSSLRFSAEMALLLAILLVTHWLSALLLTPAMFAIFRPKFAQGEGVLVEEPKPIPMTAPRVQTTH